MHDMATEKPKTPPGINKFKAMLEQVASVPKKDVDARVEALKQKAKKRRGKK